MVKGVPNLFCYLVLYKNIRQNPKGFKNLSGLKFRYNLSEYYASGKAKMALLNISLFW